jgi:outer membrane autotransporter protein
MDADTDGHHWIAGAKAGYLMALGGIRLGPVAALDYAKVKVDGYTEDGDAALTLNVDSIKADSLRGSLGAELRADLGDGGTRFRPYGSAVIEKEFSDGERSVHFAQTSAPGIVNSFAFDDISKKAYGRFTGGASAAIVGGVTMDASLSFTAGKQQGEETSAHVGLKLAL